MEPATYEAPSQAAATARIKDVASLQAGRDNQLIGYGLVVGLQGTGDSLRSSPFTDQSMRAMLQNLGISTQGGQSNAKNVAEFKAGNEKALNGLVGQIMKASKGKANPQQVNDLLRSKLAG